MFTKQNFYNMGILGSFLLLLSVAYWPAISMRYAYHDSLVFFLDTDVRLWPPGTLFSFVTGRYLGAVFLVIIGRLVSQIEDLQILRFLSVVQLSICGLLIVNFLRKNFLKPLESFFIVVILLTLPAFQILVCQGGMAFYPLSILIAFLSFILCFNAPEKKGFLNYCSLQNLNAIFFMVISLSIYPPGAMFFWALATAFVIFSKKKNFFALPAKIFRIFFVGFCGMVFYRILLEFTKKTFLFYNPHQDYSPYLLANDLFAKVKWFLTDPTVKVLNAWNIFPKKEYAFCFIIFVVGAILLVLIQNQRKGFLRDKLKEGSAACLTLGILFFLTSLPNLLFLGNVSFYRCYVALSAFCVFLFLWAWSTYTDLFLPWGRMAKVFILFLLACFGIFQAYQTTYHYRARPSAEELRFLEQSLQGADLNKLSRIYIVQPNQEKLYTSDDEYGNLTTSFGNDMIGFLSCGILGLMKNNYKIYHIDYVPTSGKTIYFFKKEEEDKPNYSYRMILDFGFEAKTKDYFSEPTLIIDMNKVVDRLLKS